jgi:hypothetical protein
MLPFGLARNEKSCSCLLEDTNAFANEQNMHTEFRRKHYKYAIGEFEKHVVNSYPAYIFLFVRMEHSDFHRTYFREISKIFNKIFAVFVLVKIVQKIIGTLLEELRAFVYYIGVICFHNIDWMVSVRFELRPKKYLTIETQTSCIIGYKSRCLRYIRILRGISYN